MLNTIDHILQIFELFRMTPTAIDQYESKGKEILKSKLSKFVDTNQTIQFVMLGFPFKSTNSRDKVLGVLPDKAEEVTLNNFRMFNKMISEVYSPGINITMASDGYAFNDILGVSDRVVEQYQEISMDMAKGGPVSWFNVKDAYSGDLNTIRGKLVDQFGISWEALQQRILLDPDVNFLYRGMIRFMEEELAIKQFPSKNQLHVAAKKLTREMMLINEAYSKLVSTEFSNNIRLSMHPSVNNGAKYSFQLIPGKNVHHSAWHCALFVDGDEYETIHRKDAELRGYQLIFQNKQPYYYTR